MRASVVAAVTLVACAASACAVDRSERVASTSVTAQDASTDGGLGVAGDPCVRDPDCSTGFLCAAGRCVSRGWSAEGGLPLSDAGTIESGADAGCESPGPRTCDDLQGYLEHAQNADGAALELGAGDLTLLVIFDKSGSMGSSWDLRNKWQAASDAMIAGMAPYLDNLTIGAILFPKPDACEVLPLDDVQQINFVPGRQFISEWVESACLNQPNGSTPMELAFRVADQALVGAQSLGLLDDRFRVVLVTDGEPNCETRSELLPTFADAWFRQLGVETWVIGLPGSEPAAALLDAIALAGGTTKHTPASDPCEFQGAVGAAAR